MKRRGFKQKVLGYRIGAHIGYVSLELACGHEKQATQRRARKQGSELFVIWRQRYAFCKHCKGAP
jgi:hypothetical protein